MSTADKRRSHRSVLKRFGRAVIAALALTAGVAAHAAIAFIDGEATYLERILPPPDATLVVTLQDTVRARIVTPTGLWMTTDTVVSALGGASPLSLRLVAVGAQPAAAGMAAMPASAPSADTCASAATQAAMTRCAYEDFEAAGSGYAQRLRELSQPLPAAQRDRRRRQCAGVRLLALCGPHDA